MADELTHYMDHGAELFLISNLQQRNRIYAEFSHTLCIMLTDIS
jgi:hypothetical protein